MTKTVSFLLLILTMAGCQHMAAKKAVQQYEETWNPLIGKVSQEDILSRLGEPQGSSMTGKIEVWTYHQSYGARATAYYGAARAHEVYDRLILTFDQDGVLKDWSVYVQR